PLGAVLHWHDAEVGAPALHLVEHLADGARRFVDYGRAEALEGGLVGESRLRTEVGDRQRGLEGAGRREHFPPDRADRLGGERPAVRRGQAPEDLRLTLRGIDRRTLPSFEVSDLKDGLGALVEEAEDLVVEVVNPGTPIVQVHRDSHYSGLSGYRAL